MAIDVLLGLQWGDEGKGKIVDFLAPRYDIVSRFQGGPNAGHTLEFEGIKHVLHQIPSGIFRDDIENIIGNGVVLDPVVLKEEILAVQNLNAPVKNNLYISSKAHLILPTHRALDKAMEMAKGDEKIGSTLRGIGPAYNDKSGRQGLRVLDILSDDFEARAEKVREHHRSILERFGSGDLADENFDSFLEACAFIKGYTIDDTEIRINKALRDGKQVLAEGAQGSLLDVDFGSYPYVTSSNTIAAGACTGLGVSPKTIGEVFGIFKAYCTRVGEGPFMTEQINEDGERLRKEGNEFGATTGRPRRCGWLDLPALKYSVMLNGVTQLFMTKVDVLNSLETIPICTAYELPDGSRSDILTSGIYEQDITPVYEDFKGWCTDIDPGQTFGELPGELVQYIQFIEDFVEVPVKLISVGPDRTQTILREQVTA